VLVKKIRVLTITLRLLICLAAGKFSI